MQQFIKQSFSDEQAPLTRYRANIARRLATPLGIFVIDDTGFFKQGKHSVGVQHQYFGHWGRQANCRVVVSVHYVSPSGHFSAAMWLYQPKSWIESPKRPDSAGVPVVLRCERTMPQIALELLDRVRAERVLLGAMVLADVGNGPLNDLQNGRRRLRLSYIVGVTSVIIVFTGESRWAVPAVNSPGTWPRSLPRLAGRLPSRKVTRREKTKGGSPQFSWTRRVRRRKADLAVEQERPRARASFYLRDS